MRCSYYEAGRCRSCSELSIPYAQQLRIKQQRCRDALAAWPDCEWLPTVASPEACFRNKAKMVVSGSSAEPVLGILDAEGIGVDLSHCPLYPAAMQAAFAPIRDFIASVRIAPYDIAQRRGELKFVLLTLAQSSGEMMLRFVLRSQEPVARMRKHLASLQLALPALTVISVNLQPEPKAVLEGEVEIVLTSNDRLTMRLDGLPLHLRPQSFFQTNDHVAARLYAQARAWVGEIDPPALWDLFCGVGGFALNCANGQRDVTGIEISAEAIASAELTRSELGLQRVQFRALDATDFALGATRVPQLVIVNPPRRGIGAALARFLDASPTQHLVYSSCNVESLARDIAAMPGLRLRRAGVFDMFPHTNHYEVLALLQRG